MVRYSLSKNVKILCSNPDLSDNGKYIRPIKPNETVFVNILDTYTDTKDNFVTIYIKCYYPDGHIEEGWTFRDAIPTIDLTNFQELLDGRFNQ